VTTKPAKSNTRNHHRIRLRIKSLWLFAVAAAATDRGQRQGATWLKALASLEIFGTVKQAANYS